MLYGLRVGDLMTKAVDLLCNEGGMKANGSQYLLYKNLISSIHSQLNGAIIRTTVMRAIPVKLL
jgi:hypothetical protein